MKVKKAFVPINLSSGLSSAFCPYCKRKNVVWLSQNNNWQKAMVCKHFEKVDFRPQLTEEEQKIWQSMQNPTYLTRYNKQWKAIQAKPKIPYFVFKTVTKA